MTRVELGERGAVALSPYLPGNLRMVHGDRLDPWLAALPETLATILARLEARIVPGEPPLFDHLVFFAETEGSTGVAVKCTAPNDEQPPELAAIHALSDAGIGPRLLWADLSLGALAMKRVRPGDMLPREMPSLDDDATIRHLLATPARWETLRNWVNVANVTSACWALQGGAVPWKDAMALAATIRNL